MVRVLGIGGFFFHSRDPRALAHRYAQRLGVGLTPRDYDGEPWRQQAGATVFAPSSSDTASIGRPEQRWMLRRVRDLAAMVAQLRGVGIAVEVDAQEYPHRLFARSSDPEGDPLQLWELRGCGAGARN